MRYFKLNLGILIVLLCIALWLFDSSTPMISSARAVLPGASKETYASLVSSLDERIQSFERLVKKRDNDWVLRERLVGLLNERGSLTGNLADFKRGLEVLEDAFRQAPKGSGPLLTAARLNYSIHRLPQVDEYLSVIEHQSLIKAQTQIAALTLKANLDFHRGNYRAALEKYHSCEMSLPGLCISDLAIYYSNTAGFREAEALLELAQKKTAVDDPHRKAWLSLQLGILKMKQGLYDEALTALQAADETLPGWWLVREHIAETYVLKNQPAQALPIYQEIVEHHQLPQYMDALAETLEKLGRPEEARQYSEKAEILWNSQLQEFPEAASGHAIEHFLKWKPQDPRTLELAKKNYELRPGGEASVLLAETYLKNSLPNEAGKVLERTLSSSFKSPELYQVAAEVAEAQGSLDQAGQYRQLARQLNPLL